ncbi:hypothetical protein AAGW05_05360 [Arthrobacter sp. LAPM80]
MNPTTKPAVNTGKDIEYYARALRAPRIGDRYRIRPITPATPG